MKPEDCIDVVLLHCDHRDVFSTVVVHVHQVIACPVQETFNYIRSLITGPLANQYLSDLLHRRRNSGYTTVAKGFTGSEINVLGNWSDITSDG